MADATENNAGNIGPVPADATPYISKSGRVLTPAQVANLSNLKRPPKGVRPPHLTGRPKGTTILSALVERLEGPVKKLFDPEFLKAGKLPKQVANRKLALALADVMLKEALKGNFVFLREVLDRTYGTVAQRMAGHDGGSLRRDAAQIELILQTVAPTKEQCEIMITDPEIKRVAERLGKMLRQAQGQTSVLVLPAPSETDEHKEPIPPGENS